MEALGVRIDSIPAGRAEWPLLTAGVAPAGASGFLLAPGESYMMQVRADPIWFWTNDDQGCQLVLNEVM